MIGKNHISLEKFSFKTYYSVSELLLSSLKEETKMPNVVLWGFGSN